MAYIGGMKNRETGALMTRTSGNFTRTAELNPKQFAEWVAKRKGAL
jgi:hypothetical protein